MHVFFLNPSLIPGTPKYFSLGRETKVFFLLGLSGVISCHTEYIGTRFDDSNSAFQGESPNPDVPSQAQKSLLAHHPTLPVGLLLTKGVKFKFKAFLVNTLRTQEPPQLLAGWRRCHAQQLLRWSAETTELPSARRQPQQPGPQLCKLLSESITRPDLFGREAKSCFLLQPHKKG